MDFLFNDVCIMLCKFQVMHPSLDDIQQTLNKATQLVLEVGRGIAQWGQVRYRQPSITHLDDNHSKRSEEKS